MRSRKTRPLVKMRTCVSRRLMLPCRARPLATARCRVSNPTMRSYKPWALVVYWNYWTTHPPMHSSRPWPSEMKRSPTTRHLTVLMAFRGGPLRGRLLTRPPCFRQAPVAALRQLPQTLGPSAASVTPAKPRVPTVTIASLPQRTFRADVWARGRLRGPRRKLYAATGARPRTRGPAAPFRASGMLRTAQNPGPVHQRGAVRRWCVTARLPKQNAC
jgi:hypothetical protein